MTRSIAHTTAGTHRAFAFLCAGLLACALWLPLRREALYLRYDLHDYLVPEMALHLGGEHAYGPALWNPHVQLGRPATALGGLSQAYWLAHLFAMVSADPWATYTALVLATLVLGGLFAWGFFRELGLHPTAAAACALGFAFAPFHGHAGLYLSFVGGSVWTMGLAWALARNLRACTHVNGVLLAFVVHSAILASYPQQLVLAAWLVPCFALALLPPRGRRARTLLVVVAWTALGVLSTTPLLLDVLERVRSAGRFAVTPDRAQIPDLTGVRDLLQRLQELGDPLWRGRESFTPTGRILWGTSLTPFFGAAMLAALAAWRAPLVRVAAGFALVTLLLGLSKSTYAFGIRHLGLRFSAFQPFAAATVPLFLLAAIGLDRCLRLRGSRRRSWLAAILPVLLLTSALAGRASLDRWNVAVSFALAACAAVALLAPVGPVLAAGALISAFHYGVLELPAAAREGIDARVRWQAPLAEEVARRAAGGRFAWVSEQRPLLLVCNSESLHGLTSIHSNDSIASQRYREWTERVSERAPHALPYLFEFVRGTAQLGSEDFARAGVRVILADRELHVPGLVLASEQQRTYVHEVREPAPLEAWVPQSACELAAGAARIPARIADVGRAVERRARTNEWIELALEPQSESGVLWLSQQFHPRWRARAGDTPLETVEIDGFWQGVLVPAGTRAITLEFRPWLRFWWVAQLGFALVGVGLALRHAARSVRSRSAKSARVRSE